MITGAAGSEDDTTDVEITFGTFGDAAVDDGDATSDPGGAIEGSEAFSQSVDSGTDSGATDTMGGTAAGDGEASEVCGNIVCWLPKYICICTVSTYHN